MPRPLALSTTPAFGIATARGGIKSNATGSIKSNATDTARGSTKGSTLIVALITAAFLTLGVIVVLFLVYKWQKSRNFAIVMGYRPEYGGYYLVDRGGGHGYDEADNPECFPIKIGDKVRLTPASAPNELAPFKWTILCVV